MLGVTRKIDELGRVVIPMEFRKSMGIEPEILEKSCRKRTSYPVLPASEKRCVSCGSEEYLHTLRKICRAKIVCCK